VVKIQVEVFWVAMACSFVVGCQCFWGPCCLHLKGEVQMEAAKSSKPLVSYWKTTWHCKPEDLNLKGTWR